MSTVSSDVLLNIFAGTQSPEKDTRESAERALGELSAQHNDLVLHLLRLSCAAVPASGDPQQQQQYRNAILAASIRVRNVLGRSDWGRNPYFTEEVKLEVRQVIVPLQCQPHVPELVRRQILDTTKSLILYDYPDRWPGLVPQLMNLLDGWVAALRSALNASGGNVGSELVMPVVLQLKGGLSVLRACCKLYQDPLRVDAKAVDRFAALTLPSLVSLSELLFGLWRGELEQLASMHQQNSSTGIHDLPRLGNMFEFTPILTELSNCLRMILKCSWSFITARMPKCLCAGDAFQGFWTTCIANAITAFHTHYLPLCRARLQAEAHLPGASDDVLGDHFAVFQESAQWKQLKWVYTIAYKLVQEFMRPASCEKRARAVATGFRDTYLLPTVQYGLELIRWHACPATAGSPGVGGGADGSPTIHLTSKAFIMAVEMVTSATESEPAYTTIIHPVAEELMTGLLFPRLAFSIEDAELWLVNPEEYVRKQSNPAGDLFSAKVVSASCLLSLAVPSSKFHDSALLGALVNFLVNLLQLFSPQAAQAASEEASGPAAMEAARRVDAALFCIHQFKKVLKHMQLGDDKLEFVLSTFVVPATRYPLGFLRARAVLVLSVFAPSIEWSSPQAYQTALQAVLPLLGDAETPVRVQTCVSFSRLIRHPHAREVVTPRIAQLIQHYFDVMRLMDNEAVVRTLRKTIYYYNDSLSQWGLELADLLVSHFQTVLQNVNTRYQALESEHVGATAGDCLDDDGFADVLMAADELLDTLTTLVLALPSQPEDRPDNTFTALQYRISPMLFVILSHQGGSVYGFMDPVLKLLTTLLSRSPRVVEPTWQLLPCLYQRIRSGGAMDYYGEMLPPLDNYVSVAPQPFVSTPLRQLCGASEEVARIFAPDLLDRAPIELVEDMSLAVLQNTTMEAHEKTAVPKVYDCVLQALWLLRTTSGDAAAAAPGTAVSRVTQQLVGFMSASSEFGLQQQQQQSGKKRRLGLTTSTLRVLFSNAVFSCVLAEPEAALQVLGSSGAMGTFFEQYVTAVLGTASPSSAAASPKKKGKKSAEGGSAGAALSWMRGYDRKVFVLALCESIQLLSRTAWTAMHDALLSTLQAVVGTTIIETFAEDERAQGQSEVALLQKRVNKLRRQQQQQQQQQGGGNNNNNNNSSSINAGSTVPDAGAAAAAGGDGGDDAGEDWEEWDSENDDSTDDDDDDDGFGMGGDDDEDEWADDDGWEDAEDCDGDDDDNDGGAGGALGFGGEEAQYFTQDRRLQAMLRKAQQLRGAGGGGAADGNNNNDDDEFEDIADDGEEARGGGVSGDENLLDEEDDSFSSPVDAVNVWAVLVDEILAPLSTNPSNCPQLAALVGAFTQHNPNDVLQAARAATDQLLAVRAEFASLSGAI